MENNENKTGFINYKGKSIFFFDLNGCDSEETIKRINIAIPDIRTKPEGSVLFMTDMENMVYNSDSLALGKEFVKGNAPYVKKSAILGVTGLKKVAFQTLVTFSGRKNLRAFDSIEEAQEWLIADDQPVGA